MLDNVILHLIIAHSLCVAFKTLKAIKLFFNALKTLKHKPFFSGITTDAGSRRRLMTSHLESKLKVLFTRFWLISQKYIEMYVENIYMTKFRAECIGEIHLITQ